jgi:hypothetical protein
MPLKRASDLTKAYLELQISVLRKPQKQQQLISAIIHHR